MKIPGKRPPRMLLVIVLIALSAGSGCGVIVGNEGWASPPADSMQTLETFFHDLALQLTAAFLF